MSDIEGKERKSDPRPARWRWCMRHYALLWWSLIQGFFLLPLLEAATCPASTTGHRTSSSFALYKCLACQERELCTKGLRKCHTDVKASTRLTAQYNFTVVGNWNFADPDPSDLSILLFLISVSDLLFFQPPGKTLTMYWQSTKSEEFRPASGFQQSCPSVPAIGTRSPPSLAKLSVHLMFLPMHLGSWYKASFCAVMTKVCRNCSHNGTSY